MDKLQAAVDAKESRQDNLNKFEKIREDFDLNSTAFGGILMAGVLVAALVFSKRA